MVNNIWQRKNRRWKRRNELKRGRGRKNQSFQVICSWSKKTRKQWRAICKPFFCSKREWEATKTKNKKKTKETNNKKDERNDKSKNTQIREQVQKQLEKERRNQENKICKMFKKIGKHRVKWQTHEQEPAIQKGENTEKQTKGWYIRKTISKKENIEVKKRFFPKRNFCFK